MPDEPDNGLELGAAERGLVDRLLADRPVPAPAFLGALGRHLAARDPGYGPRPEGLRMIVLAYLLAGLILIGVGAVIAAGSI